MKKEKLGQNFFFFFWTVRIEDWSGTSAESVSKKTKQPSSKTKVESADEERKNWSEYFFFFRL